MPFEIVNQNEYLLVRLKGEGLGDENPSIQQAVEKEITSSSLKLVVFQCADCPDLPGPVLRQLSQVFRTLKTTNGSMRLVGASKAVIEAIKRNGLDRILVNKMSLRGALVDFGLVKTKDFDVNFINPFLSSTQRVLKIQCFTEARPGKPFLKKPTDPLLLGDISGIISITSETFVGTLAISFPEAIFLKIASKMLGEEMPAISESNVDIVGELANIILGQAKIQLSALGYGIQMALPSCVWGKDHKIKHFGGGMCVVIPFETDFGIFHAEIMANNNLLNQVKDSKTAAAA